jgi:hypothetical protein
MTFNVMALGIMMLSTMANITTIKHYETKHTGMRYKITLRITILTNIAVCLMNLNLMTLSIMTFNNMHLA